MKATIFTLFLLVCVKEQLNAQKTFQKLISGPSGLNVSTSLTKTNEGNFILNTTSSEELTFCLLSKNADTIWSNVYNDGLADAYISAASAVQVADSGYITAFINKPNSSLARTGIILLKINKSGDVLWSKKIYSDSITWNYMSKIQTTADGNLVLAGNGIMPKGMSGFLLKIDPLTGNTVWLKSIETTSLTTGGDGIEYFYNVFPAKDSSVIVCGTAYRANNHAEMIYGKYSSKGAVLWLKKLKITNVLEDSYINAVVETTDGGYAFAGTSYSGSYESRGIVFKTDQLGNPLWAKSFSGSKATAVKLIANGDPTFTVVGRYRGEVTNQFTGYIAKMGKDGDVKWYNTIDHFDLKTPRTKKDIYFNSVEKSPDGGYTVGANSYAVKRNAFNDSFLVVKFDKNGVGCNDAQPVAYNPLNVTYSQPAFTIDTADATSFLQVTELTYTKSNKPLGVRIVCTAAATILAVSAETKDNIAAKDRSTLSVKVSPNPVGNMLFVNLNTGNKAHVNLSIRSIDGRIVYQEDIVSANTVINKAINIASLPKAVYFICVTEGENRKTGKFIKE